MFNVHMFLSCKAELLCVVVLKYKIKVKQQHHMDTCLCFLTSYLRVVA